MAIIQEPYSKREDNGRYKGHKHGDKSKAEIWTRTELNAKTIQELADVNYVIIRLDNGYGQRAIYVTSLYAEHGGNENRRLQEWREKLTDQHKRQLLAGDFNAHPGAWGNDGIHVRGEDILAWANEKGFHIANDIRQGSTFETRGGRSSIDLTLGKNGRCI